MIAMHMTVAFDERGHEIARKCFYTADKAYEQQKYWSMYPEIVSGKRPAFIARYNDSRCMTLIPGKGHEDERNHD